MKTQSYRLILITLIGILMYSCQKDDETHKSNTFPEDSGFLVPQNERMIILGEQLENPYAIETMQKALHNLSDTSLQGVSTQQISIEPTHLYIKFLPQNEEELNILKRDSTLILYDHPLDYEILENGDYYHDPEVPVGQPTYQYCAIETSKQLPDGVEAEILAELYIPDEDIIEDEQQQVQALSFQLADPGVSVDALVDEALRITNNLTEPTQSTATSNDLEGVKVSYRRSKWRPAGTIKVYDDVLERYVGVEGVKVRARRWFTTHTGIANSDGKYSCNGRFRRDANYSIRWKRNDFTIRWSWLSAAKYNGPKKRGDWDLNIKGGTQEFYATIFRAAHHYYYKNIKGLKRPPQNYSWKTKVKINAKYETNNDANGQHCKDCRWFGIFSRIYIYNPNNSSSQIYATTIHELAHASHWELRRGEWNDNNLETKVKESWARGVEWELTRMVYPSSKYKGRGFSTGNYTLIVSDLIDTNNSRNTNYGYGSDQTGGTGQDQVSGYTIQQIEDVLEDTSSWEDWKNNIKNRYDNDTEEHLDRLFKAYE